MQGRGRRAAHKERNTQACGFHGTRRVHHLVEARRDQAAQAYEVGLALYGLLHDALGGAHHAEVADFIIVAAHHYADDVLANVVHVAFHRGQHHPTRCCGLRIVCFDMRLQERNGFLHGSRRAHHLRQEHLARAEERAHFCHAVHERAFNDAHRWAVDSKGFLEVGFEIIVNTFQ